MKKTYDDIAEEAESLGIPTTWIDNNGKEKPISKARLLYAIKHFKLREQSEIQRDSQRFREITDLKKNGQL